MVELRGFSRLPLKARRAPVLLSAGRPGPAGRSAATRVPSLWADLCARLGVKDGYVGMKQSGGLDSVQQRAGLSRT